MTTHSRSVQHLRDYVAVPSVNPMGRSDLPEAIVGETRLAEHLLAQLSALSVDAVLVGAGARKSVVAEISAGSGTSETVLVASHIDTVPVDHMDIDPFDPVVRDGRMYGRGSCDTKAGMAALIAALERVLPQGRLRRNLVLVGEADEELSSVGVHDVLAHLGTRRPDWVLATEPTSLQVIHAHKGVVHIRIEASGRAGHASDPAAGHNAIVDLSRAVGVLDGIGARLADTVHPELGAGTLSVGLMGGGQAPNIVPDAAWLIADRRSLPGETTASIRQEIEAALQAAGLDSVTVTNCSLEKPALGTPPDHHSVRACALALERCGHVPQTGVVAFGTDAGVFAEVGVPGVVMGPGSIERAHTAAEYVELDELEAMVDIFEALLSGDG